MRNAICIIASLALAAGCGDDTPLHCGPGTYKDGNNCSAHDPNDKTAPVTTASPKGARSRAPVPSSIVLAANEPATIYYTTDGSEPDMSKGGEPSPAVIPTVTNGMTVKFFSVDTAGNQESTNTETYVTDTKAPASVANFQVTVSGTTATATWTNPTDADFKGTLLARIDDLADAAPKPGMLYTTGTALSTSVNAVAVGNTTTFADTGRATGPVRYAIWAFDDLGNYSAPAYATASVGTVDTTATFTFDVDTTTLSQTQTPASIDYSGTTASYDSGTSVLTLHLSAKNLTGIYFQSPKAEVPSVTNATLSGATGTADGNPFVTLGQNFFAPAQTETADLTFSGAAAGTLVTIQLTLGTHPLLMASGPRGCCSGHPHSLFDTGSGLTFADIPVQASGRNGRFGGVTRPGLLTAQHYFDSVSTHNAIERWDLSTFTRIGGTNVSGRGQGIVMSLHRAGGNELAVTKSASKRSSGGVTVYSFDESLRANGSLDTGVTQGRGMSVSALSADGTLLAVPGTGDIALVDPIALALVDADTSTPVVDPIHVFTNGERVREVTFFNGTQGLVAVSFSGSMAYIKHGSGGYTATTVGTNGKARSVAVAADGKVWVASDGGISVYDPSDDSFVANAYPHGAYALTVLGGTVYALRSDKVHVDQLDATGAVVKSSAMPQSAQGEWLQATTP